MKRIICLLLLICLAIPAAAFAEEHEYIGRMMVVNCKREVSLRAEPTQKSERMNWVSYHTVLENCISGYGDYYYVEYLGVPGYIHKDYLEVYDGPDLIYEGEIYEEMQIVGCPKWTPLREMADVNSKQIAKLPLGAVVTDCEYYADDYTYVHYDGMEGYVLTEYITLGSGNDAQPDLSVKYVTNCEEKVSLRAKPTSSSERLAWVPKGTAMEALDAENGYFYVYCEGEYGYIHGDYLAYIGYTGQYVGDMTVVDCEYGAPLMAEPVPGFGWLAFVPEGTVVQGCYEAHDGYYWVVYDELGGYIHGDFLEMVLEPDEEFEVEPKAENYGLGVYLISDSMGGDWSILQEKHQLKNVLLGIPEEWQLIAMTIPDERIIEIAGGNHLFMLVPSDDIASITVYRLELGFDGFTGNREEILYQSETNKPFLLRCNEYAHAMDSEIIVEDSAGNEFGWYPDVHPETGRITVPQEEDAVYYELNEYGQE